ncbi:ABC transporter permease [Kordiimonas pumila]|uniref:ABC transporter permease n=1 Tax=Kordiimonas pumila TaxID=2161677 RepID=A0ABV7D0A6_9PROT|nr:MlaE family lipid ABC transporter permease subunit [Kordiimonas pumila]
MASIGYESDFFCVESGTPSALVRLIGVWTIENAEIIEKSLNRVLQAAGKSGAVIDCTQITALDTTGAVLIRHLAFEIEAAGAAVLTGVSASHKNLLDVIHCKPPQVATEPDTLVWYIKMLEEAGRGFLKAAASLMRLIGFLGLVLVRLFGTLLAPGRIRLVPLMYQMEVVGLNAMGIVGLIAFLIGAVLVNQGAIQLAKFGADVFVIDMLGIVHLREMGVLLTAIIIAGRSGSAFTAQIGSMKLNEEVDAMRTIGMNPIDVLVLPRLMALMVCLPLLTFYADIVGIMGGVTMAWWQLDISPANFLVYFRDVISVDHYVVGLIKAPFFAAVIASCGCYQGLRVEGSADSLGERTTRSVVQAIFLVIVLDAMFAVFFTAVDI